MTIKTELFLFCLFFCILSLCMCSADKRPAVDEKKTTASIYMNPEKNTLWVTDQLEGSGSKKMNRIFFNDKDYTTFAGELLDKYPLSFASCNFLIFGKNKAVLSGDQLECRGGIVFIPRNDEVLIIKLSDISYNERTRIIKGNNAKWKKIALSENKVEEKELKKMSLNLSSPTGVTIHMNSIDDTLTVTGHGLSDIDGKIQEVIFNNKDYTKFVETLIASQPLCFASSRILIFGEGSAELIDGQWKCDRGIIFIPGEKEIRIIDATGISFNEKRRILKAKNAKIEKLSLNMKHKETKEEPEMTVDFSKI